MKSKNLKNVMQIELAKQTEVRDKIAEDRIEAAKQQAKIQLEYADAVIAELRNEATAEVHKDLLAKFESAIQEERRRAAEAARIERERSWYS